MADKKIDKALYGPSVTEVALGAILGLLLGVLVACVYLVFRPVSLVQTLPKEPLRSVVYYIPGKEGSAKSKGWQAKQKQFLAGTSVAVVEEELNAWSTSSGTAAPAASAAKPAPKAPAPAAKPKPAAKPAEEKAEESKPVQDGFIIPYAANFRVVDDKLQIGLKCTLNWYGLTYDTTVVATGGFGKSGDQVVFVPELVYLGSCPLHLLPSLPGMLVSHIIAKEKVSDEVRTAWTKLTAVTIEGGAVKLTVQ
ncbi:MAG: hypothetical protein PSU94_02380 [Lacunisphaera sp.]|nr:hypothetical protein [Lacunisphaera sp.]